ncbi:hypothetical protein ADUPG1_008829, partial [Aduncisulcus paluster]
MATPLWVQRLKDYNSSGGGGGLFGSSSSSGGGLFGGSSSSSSSGGLFGSSSSTPSTGGGLFGDSGSSSSSGGGLFGGSSSSSSGGGGLFGGSSGSSSSGGGLFGGSSSSSSSGGLFGDSSSSSSSGGGLFGGSSSSSSSSSGGGLFGDSGSSSSGGGLFGGSSSSSSSSGGGGLFGDSGSSSSGGGLFGGSSSSSSSSGGSLFGGSSSSSSSGGSLFGSSDNNGSSSTGGGAIPTVQLAVVPTPTITKLPSRFSSESLTDMISGGSRKDFTFTAKKDKDKDKKKSDLFGKKDKKKDISGEYLEESLELPQIVPPSSLMSSDLHTTKKTRLKQSFMHTLTPTPHVPPSSSVSRSAAHTPSSFGRRKPLVDHYSGSKASFESDQFDHLSPAVTSPTSTISPMAPPPATPMKQFTRDVPADTIKSLIEPKKHDEHYPVPSGEFPGSSSSSSTGTPSMFYRRGTPGVVPGAHRGRDTGSVPLSTPGLSSEHRGSRQGRESRSAAPGSAGGRILGSSPVRHEPSPSSEMSFFEEGASETTYARSAASMQPSSTTVLTPEHQGMSAGPRPMWGGRG